MKNKMKKLSAITLTIIATFTQIGCGPLFYGLEDGENYGGDYSNYEKEKLDPTTLDKTEKVETPEPVGLCEDKRKEYLSLSDATLFDLASAGQVGNCRINDASTCESCFCSAYVKVTTATWPQYGWALNPNSEDSTGCVSHTQYPGYTPAMAGNNLTLNAVEQIRDALRHKEDVCGLCDSTRPITVEMILE